MEEEQVDSKMGEEDSEMEGEQGDSEKEEGTESPEKTVKKQRRHKSGLICQSDSDESASKGKKTNLLSLR